MELRGRKRKSQRTHCRFENQIARRRIFEFLPKAFHLRAKNLPPAAASVQALEALDLQIGALEKNRNKFRRNTQPREQPRKVICEKLLHFITLAVAHRISGIEPKHVRGMIAVVAQRLL